MFQFVEDFFILAKHRSFDKFMKILGCCKFGINPGKSLQIYNVCIRSKMEYASAALVNADKKPLTRFETTALSFLKKSLGMEYGD